MAGRLMRSSSSMPRAATQFSARPLSSSSSPPTPLHEKGFCFDIDGVLLRGYELLPRAREALLRLAQARIPFLLVTNGGGEVEWRKALALSKVLGVRIHPEQLVISSTPLRAVCRGLADARVLVLGCRDVLGVARSYGLRRAVTAPMLAADDPTRYPFHATPRLPLDPSVYGPPDEPFGAVMTLHDPTDYADLQLALDVLRGGWPYGSGGSTQTIPYYISNNDLLFAGVYPVPRLAGGSFTVALSALWGAVTGGGTPLAVTVYGKPSLHTSGYAREQLGRWAGMSETLDYASWAEVRGGGGADLTAQEWEARASEFASLHHAHGPELPSFKSIYMVGDNPRADIALVANAGQPWVSCLVRTGVFQGATGTNDALHPADHVVQGVGEAVELALRL